MLPQQHVWIFNGEGGRFPGGVFTRLDVAETWIAKHRLSGVLTAYPLDEGCLAWAIRENITRAEMWQLADGSLDPDVVGSFSDAAQEHFHYVEGHRG